MIEPPLESDEKSELVDWLELVALLSADKSARLDLLVNALDIAEDNEEEDIADADSAREAFIEELTEEIRRREELLSAEAYAFQISDNGECLSIHEELTYGHKTYLACLVLSQSWTIGKLTPPLKLTDDESRAGRNHFEILSAVAALGATGGPSFLLGTNRAGAQGLLNRVAEICELVNEGSARPALHAAAPQAANDDKVDILAVELENDGPPHRNFWFCQSAAGANYTEKPIINEMARFLEIWFQERPVNYQGAIFCPKYMSQTELVYQTHRLGHIYHRLRMPHYAQKGMSILGENPDLLRYVDDTNVPSAWLDAYLERASAEFAQ